jgi:predicted TIM-barrel fold metal-dependent hydrolase
MGRRVVMISGDAHLGSFSGNWWGAEDYIDPEFRDVYLEQQAANPPVSWTPDRLGYLQPAEGAKGAGGATHEGVGAMYRERLEFVREHIGDPVEAGKLVGGFAVSGDMDWQYRLKELEADGVVGDIVFPQGNPFMATLMATGGGHPFNPNSELGRAGRRAVNRWLADFAAMNPERHAIPVVCDINDIDECVEDIHWGKEHGLRGGFAPVQQGSPELFGLPLWNDPYYEPIWNACNELEYPVAIHIGAPTVSPVGRGGPALFAFEYWWLGRRPIRYMIFGGVFERNPNVKLLLSEAVAGWVIDELDMMDRIFRGETTSSIRAEGFRDSIDLSSQRGELTHLPSEYFAEHCFVNTGAWAEDWRRRRDKGYDITGNMIWGNDYPHPEGTWPHSVAQLRQTIDEVGVPIEDVRKILGENAARVFGFDLDVLQPIADRVGPEFD